MKKMLVSLVVGLSLMGCAQTERVVIQGEIGPGGQRGEDGFSVVSTSFSDLNMCGLGRTGNQVTLALDLDRSQSFSDGDLVQTQYITCDGAVGSSGLGCSVVKTGRDAIITCGNNSVTISDGATGSIGPMGPSGVLPSGIFISEFLNPCGAEFNNDEVLMKMSNGKIVGVYDGGPNEDRLTIFAPGDYITTDRNNNIQCRFTLNSSGNLVNQKICQGSSNHCSLVGSN